MVCIVSEKGELWERPVVNGIKQNILISSHGRIFNIKKEKIVEPYDNGAGYKYYNLQVNCKVYHRYIHRLVATMFIPNPDDLPQVNHIDCDKSNNHIDNLEWVSCSDNILDAHKNKRMTKRSEYGEIRRLTSAEVDFLYREVKQHGKGITQTATDFGISRTSLSSVLNKKSHVKQTDAIGKELAEQCQNTTK